MKALSYVFLTLVSVLTLSCEQGDDPERLDKSALVGTWRLSETLADPGDGSGRWRPVSEEGGEKIVEFKQDGKLGGTAFHDFKQYVIKDSITVTFSKENKEIQNYSYKIDDGTLTMSPAGPIQCIEACGIRFVKIE